jgi:hypothetical protein
MIYSYSSLSTYKQCPAKFNYAYIQKFQVEKEPPSPAMERGSKIHDSVELFLLGKTEFLHPDIHEPYGQFMTGLRNDYEDIRPEYKWGITWEFKPCAYDAGDCMLHGYVDLLILPKEGNLLLYEWKTGGVYIEPHTDQVHTYATAMMVNFPEYEAVDAMITWFDKVDYKKLMYPRSMFKDYRYFLRDRINQIADETRFPAMPSFKCKWCKFSRYNGGPCSVA